MNWSGAKNSVYRRITSLMLKRMEHDVNGTQKPVSISSGYPRDIRNSEV